VSVAETNWSSFSSTMSGVMTEEVGAITGELELLTRLIPAGDIEVMVRYAGAKVLFTVSGSPVHAVWAHPDQAEHRVAHERILETLTTPGGSSAATRCR
jgi:hypothetical protein